MANPNAMIIGGVPIEVAPLRTAGEPEELLDLLDSYRWLFDPWMAAWTAAEAAKVDVPSFKDPEALEIALRPYLPAESRLDTRGELALFSDIVAAVFKRAGIEPPKTPADAADAHAVVARLWGRLGKVPASA